MHPLQRSIKPVMFILTLASGMLTSAAHVNADREDPRSQVNSREFKILLKPELFIKRNEGFDRVLLEAKEAADELGVRLDFKSRRGMYTPKFRKIVFYDTADHSLRKKGYALRKRVKYKNRRLQDDFELMLKFRSTDPSAAALIDTSTAKLFASETKFEQDVAFTTDPKTKVSAVKLLYSKSTKIKNIQGDFRKVGDFAKIFPALRGLGLPMDSPLPPVGGIEYLELKIEPAKLLYFGDGLSCEFDISIWYRGEANNPMIAEISYDYPISDYPSKMTSRAVVLSENFHRLLLKKLKEKGYHHTGSTKTASVYGAE